MQTVQYLEERVKGPLTPVLARHAQSVHGRVYVQVQQRGMVLCGVLLKVRSEPPMLQVRDELGAAWYIPRNVRMCTGDGRCVCEPVPPSARSAYGGAGVCPPLGNTGGTI